MDKLFKEQSEKIRIFTATEETQDPFEKNIETTLLPSTPIRAIVTDLVASQIQYKLMGTVTENAKEIIIRKKDRGLLELSYKIKIGDDYFYGWKVNGRMQIRSLGDYVRAYVYKKND